MYNDCLVSEGLDSHSGTCLDVSRSLCKILIVGTTSALESSNDKEEHRWGELILKSCVNTKHDPSRPVSCVPVISFQFGIKCVVVCARYGDVGMYGRASADLIIFFSFRSHSPWCVLSPDKHLAFVYVLQSHKHESAEHVMRLSSLELLFLLLKVLQLDEGIKVDTCNDCPIFLSLNYLLLVVANFDLETVHACLRLCTKRFLPSMR